MKVEERDEAPIKSVRKAMDILYVLSEARRPLRVSDIAAQMKMSASAVSRLVATLSKRSLAYQDEETGRCYLGLGLTVLGADALGRHSLDRIALSIMEELANRMRAYVGLGRLSQGKVVIIRTLPAPLNLQGAHTIIVAPTHVCAPGKILCGALSDGEITTLLATHGMDPLTPNTIVEPNRFLQAVEAARKAGFAIDDQESAHQIRHIACPIHDHHGSVIATLSAGGPVSEFTQDDIQAQILTLSHGCLRISRELGYRGDAAINLDALGQIAVGSRQSDLAALSAGRS